MKLSIITTAYNCETYLKESLESIFSQKIISEHEIVLVNDGSTDSTRDILSDFASKNTNVVLIDNENNLGVPVSRNKALEVTKGDYIAIHDGDDISLDNRFQNQIDYLDAHSNITFMGGHAVKISESGETIGSLSYPPETTQQAFSVITRFKLNPIIDPSVMYRKETIVQHGSYSTDPKFRTVQDFELWCRLLVRGCHMTNFQHPIIKYRINPNGVSIKEKDAMLQATDLVWGMFRRRVLR